MPGWRATWQKMKVHRIRLLIAETVMRTATRTTREAVPTAQRISRLTSQPTRHPTCPVPTRPLTSISSRLAQAEKKRIG